MGYKEEMEKMGVFKIYNGTRKDSTPIVLARILINNYWPKAK